MKSLALTLVALFALNFAAQAAADKAEATAQEPTVEEVKAPEAK